MAVRSRWMGCLCVPRTPEHGNNDDTTGPDKSPYALTVHHDVHHDEQGNTLHDDEQEVLPAAPFLVVQPTSDSASSSQHHSSLIRASSSRRLSDLGSTPGSSGSDAVAKDLQRVPSTPIELVHQFMHAYEAALQDNSATPQTLQRHMEHLFTQDAKLTTMDSGTVHGRRGVLGRLEKGVQQLKQMAAAGDAARTGVHIGEVHQEEGELFVVGLRLQRGVLKLSLRVEFGVRSMERGVHRICTLAFRRG